MAGWREDILREFMPGVAPLTVVADPDGLLLEEGLLEELRARGFESVLFEDRIAFASCNESRPRPTRGPGDRAPERSLEPGRDSLRRVAGWAPALVQPRRSVSQPESRGRQHIGPRRSRRPPCGQGPGAACTTARRVADPGIRAAAPVRDRAGDDRPSVGSAPLPAAPPLPDCDCRRRWNTILFTCFGRTPYSSNGPWRR